MTARIKHSLFSCGFALCAITVLLFSAESAKAACSSPTANIGSLDFQSSVFKYCDGSSWQSIGGTPSFPLTGPSGTATGPTYSFSAGTNTGMYLLGPGTLAFTTAGTIAGVINNLGYHGIGTTTPAYRLDVAGAGAASSGTAIARFADVTGADRVFVIDEKATGTMPSGVATYGAYGLGLYNRHATGSIKFHTLSSDTERMRIDGATGNVGIGTTSPLVPLQIGSTTSSNIRLDTSNNNYPSLQLFWQNQESVGITTNPGGAWGVSSGAYGGVRLGNSSTSFGYIIGNSTGDIILNPTGKSVGIGTTSPTGTLDVRGGTATAGNGTSINIYAQSGLNSGNTYGGNINLIPGNGNGSGFAGGVGINSTQAGNGMVLRVGGHSRFDSTIGIEGYDGSVYSSGPVSQWGGSAPVLSMANDMILDNTMVTIQLAPRNTASTYQNGYITAISTSTGYAPAIAIGASTTSSGVYAERMRIDSNGNVGIGTNNPQYTLDVPGGSVNAAMFRVSGNYPEMTWWGGSSTLPSLVFAANTGLRYNTGGGPSYEFMYNNSFLAVIQNPTGAINTGWNAASAVAYFAKDGTTNRSINAAGTVNASGADFAEWVDWEGVKPAMGSVVFYRGSYVVVSAPSTAAFVGNDVKNPETSILVAFAGQLPVLVRGITHEGDLIVANDDGTARAVPKQLATMSDAYRAVGTAWASSDDPGLKRVHVAVGIGLAGGARDVASANAKIEKLQQENSELKARLDKIEKMLNSK